ncbi:uncharacterized protein BO97DRAFT_419909 [Aspergillus homomorphus CBS 101889]|uniref:Uncharacterized protein n=1 Tax=Aspergillus homomorphus (strain CBS 101889) TaxID=1450537 RepID=A0A395IET8_ASPHC|nr:hypothetical protein BO97DRAFT_419909 [Aspergillus homomorphus CBS 101889]RAL17678.1 hypothetical protein BO97DRAFT_419909 [Aspergillus homomorphus CBS 101889]
MKFSVAVVSTLLVALGVAMPIPSPDGAAPMQGADLFSALASAGGLGEVLRSIQISTPFQQ